ncbi:MAG: glycosyltransferase family 4 protein [Acidilobaceae archaeon]|nr:glycosyltransferase family 4 protein [Acidilobaceae archaeon]MCX8165630.1 glycosyltransferase family 4 protein [Acidilobaceae archaeon]MDW7974056.1 glycosyltransferase family 4 protein [Sulfolobales archaeon]
MRVCLAIDWHPNSIGGVQSHVRDLYRVLRRRGVDVCIISRKIGVREAKVMNEEGHYLVDSAVPLDALIVPPRREDVRQILQKASPDLIHAHHIFTLLPLLSIDVGKELKIPSVATNHTIFLAHDSRRLWRAVSILLPTRRYLKHSKAVISVSRAADKFVESIMGPDFSAKRYVISGGVDTEKYKPGGEEDYVLFVGRLVFRKGLHVLLAAFSKLEHKDSRLLVVGRGYMEVPAGFMIKSYGLERRVQLLGALPEREKLELFRRAKVVVVPSIVNESMGVVALEAMASGKPVIATKVGGLEEIVEDGKTGLLVPPGDSESLAKALDLLLSDKELRSKLGHNARRAAEEKYSWNAVVEKIMKVYNEARDEREG